MQSQTPAQTDAKNQTTILIVDDDMFLLDLYASRFTQEGFSVTSASNGKEALDKITAGFAPQVMLLDVVMPVMDGFELLEALTADHLLETTVKIFLTNLSREEDMVRGRTLGAAGYIIKASSTPSEVVTQVRTIIDDKKLVH